MLRQYGEYEQLTDEELIDNLRSGGASSIMDYICDKYKDLVLSKAKTMYILGGDTEDLIQEGMIGLFKAVRDYDAGRDASFYTFADLCISRQIYTALQASNRQKHQPLNSYISLYSQIRVGEEGEEHPLLEDLVGEGGMSPEERILDRERVEDLEQQIARELSAFEMQVLELHIVGMKVAAIARVLGRDEKSVDNALQRLRGKIKKIL